MKLSLSFVISIVLLINCPTMVSVVSGERAISVRYGYFREARPFGTACARGWFDLVLGNDDVNDGEDRTVYRVSCYPQTSGGNAVSRLDNQQLEVSLLGSTPLAEAAARGVDIQVVYIEQYKGDSQGIYVRASEEGYERIEDPFDLRGRRLGLPFGSTIHYQVLYVLDLFGLSGEVELINMPASRIIEAWNERSIDAAACWGEARDYILQGNEILGIPPAETLLSARVMSDWSRPTYNVAVARRQFAKDHPEFMKHFVGILWRLNDSFLDRLGDTDEDNARRWNSQLPTPDSVLPTLADGLMSNHEQPQKPSQDYINLQRRTLELFDQQTVEEQLSCDYLGRCGTPTLQHTAIRETAEFLMDQKIISSLGQLSDMGDTDGCIDTGTLCGGTLFNPAWLEDSYQPCSGCHRVGRYSNETADVDSVLYKLEQLDAQYGRDPFGINETGRNGGDSTCSGMETVSLNDFISSDYSFGDGANGMNGKIYSANKNCLWQVRAPDCPSSTSSCEEVVEVSFLSLRTWSGDLIKVYTDPDFNCLADSPRLVLLGQLSGFYDPDEVPPFRINGCILVQFQTDIQEERSYADQENLGTGFLAVARLHDGCTGDIDCSGSPCSSSTGLCECRPGSWGGDCSKVDHCMGTQYIDVDSQVQDIFSNEELFISNTPIRDSLLLNPDVVHSSVSYPNDLDCTFIVRASRSVSHLQLSILFDLEEPFDLLRLQTGADGSERGIVPYVELTGNSKGEFETFYVPFDDSGVASIRLITDSRGRRHGFYAKVVSTSLSENPCNGGNSGSNCEIPYCKAENTPFLDSYFLDSNSFYSAVNGLTSTYMLGRLESQNSFRSVRSMPWAPEGGCIWRFNPTIVPNFVAIRLGFNSPLDLEPHPPSSIGDKFVISNSAQSSEFFVEQCDSDEICSFPWQNGACVGGSCVIRKSIDIEMTSIEDLSAALITDGNDGGVEYHGLDIEVFFVEQCPVEGREHCENLPGATCVNGGCICDGGSSGTYPCFCPCDGESRQVVGDLNIALVVGIVVPVFLLFLVVFWWYRRRKIRKSRAQKQIIEAKEAELDVLRKSVVGMRTVIKHYVPSVSSGGVKQTSFVAMPPPSVTWCWEETPEAMGIHDKSLLLGEGHWVKYYPETSANLEAAYQAQKFQGTFSPLEGYVVDFGSLTQTKVATSFVRKVKRVVNNAPTVQQPKEVDLSNAQKGSFLPLELCGEPQMVLVKGDLLQISKQRQDGWAFGTKLRHMDEALARKLVKAVTLGQGDDDSNVSTDSGWFQLSATDVPSAEDLDALKVRIGNVDALGAPDHWTDVADPTVVQLYKTKPGDPERKAVEEAFKTTLKPPNYDKKAIVVSVSRVQNLAMWQSYVVKRQTICYRERSNQADGSISAAEMHKKAIDRFERCWLWHGTNGNVMDKIMQQGFNRSFCGKNATSYGKGVYFARDASYSANRLYAVPDEKGFQYILACRVVVGEYCKGKKDALTPDIRDATTQMLYDSTVGLQSNDTMANPAIYVTYHDAQAYPEYLIKFKATN